MGYSCAAVASFAQDAMMRLLQEAHGDMGSGNAWGPSRDHYSFFERGREQADGSVTGTVWRVGPDGLGRRAGSVKIDHHGNVVRWPGSTATMRAEARRLADLRYMTTFHRPKWDDRAADLISKMWKRLVGDAQFGIFDDSQGWGKVYNRLVSRCLARQRGEYRFDRLLERSAG